MLAGPAWTFGVLDTLGKWIVTRVLSPTATLDRTDGVSGVRDRLGFWGLVLLLCLLPIEHWRFPLNLKPADLALVSLTMYGILKAGQKRQRLDFPLIIPVWVILVFSMVATLVGLGQAESLIAISKEIYLFAWFIALVNTLKEHPLPVLDRLMKIWSVIACLVSITTVMGMLRIGPSMFYRSSYAQGTTDLIRATGTYDNSNAAAVYLSVTLFILLATTWPVWIRSALAMWLLVGMLATGSNGALLATLGSLVLVVTVFLLRDHGHIKVPIAIIGMGVGAAAAVALALAPALSLCTGSRLGTSSPLLHHTLGRFSNSLNRRLHILSWGWETYQRHPMGTGPNSFGSGLHNDYAAFLFERGPVGLMGWLWMIGATLVGSLRMAGRLIDKRQRQRVLLLGAGFFSCTVNALSHEISNMRQVWLLMVFLFALGYASLAEQAEVSTAGAE